MGRAIGFDLDDTLYDHSQYVEGAYREIASAVHRWTGVPRDGFFDRIYGDWRRLTSRGNTIFADALAAYHVYSPELERRLVDVYRNHQPTLRPYPGVAPSLSRLRRSGVPLGLLTDGQSQVQRRKLGACALEALFDVVICTGELGTGYAKPHTAGFVQLVREFGVVPSDAVYVGDNPLTDFEGPKRIGMRTVRVLTGEYRHQTAAAGLVDRTFKDVVQAMQWLLAVGKDEAWTGADGSRS